MSGQNISYETVLSGIFCMALLHQLWYYLGVFRHVAFYKRRKEPMSEQLPPVSVVICARNEENNLVAFLPYVIRQDYPVFEVIVVDDCSYDNTNDILKEFAAKHSHIRFITIKEDEHYTHGKKFALMVGIKGAKYEHLLLTDADCCPVSDNWIRNMASGFTSGKEIVIGYGGYEKRKGILNKFIRFDTFQIALQYLSFAKAGKTYMGVGRNLAYTKSLFFKNKGFASHYHIRSGDDDLFVNEASTAKNVAAEMSADSFTRSRPAPSFSAWIKQKRRHLTTARYYRPGTKFHLAVLALGQYLFWFSFVLLLLMGFPYELILSAFFLRFAVQMIVYKKSMGRLHESDLLLFSPVLELCFMLVYPVLAISNVFIKKRKWTT